MSVRLLVNREVNISRNYNLSSSIRSCIINCQVERCGESNINHWKLSIGESVIYSLLRLVATERETFHLDSFNYIYTRWIFGDLFFQTPVQGGRVGERRASSPFQNGQTEVLIGEVEGGPRSPRGSTSSAVNDANFLGPPDERDGNKPICRRVTAKKSFVSFLPNLRPLPNLKISRTTPIFDLRLFFYYYLTREEREIGEKKSRESVAVPCDSYRVVVRLRGCVASSMRWELGRLLLDVALYVFRARNLRYREIQQRATTRTFFFFLHLYSFILQL